MSKTIVAPATPFGGAIIMIRLSGSDSLDYIKALCGNRKYEERRAYYVTADTKTLKDKCIVIVYGQGNSYTGEQSAELFCHGSKVVAEEIIKFFINCGAEVAERGEFTRRAYENKRVDLAEAEAILDLINSETIEQAVSAYKNVDGELSGMIRELQDEVKTVLAEVEVAIDYPEENIEALTLHKAKLKVKQIRKGIKALTDSYGDGRKIKEGVKVVITGKPNVGKSSLFNLILGYKRAIVNKEAGTTRDAIESEYIYKGRKFVLVDTAGIRDALEETEREGIEFARKQIEEADIILGVGTADDEYAASSGEIIITNKADIKQGKGLNVSALTGQGIEELKEKIYNETDFKSSGLKINNLRQYEALVGAGIALDRALESNMTADCFAADLSEAYDSLGKVTGAIGSEEIIAEIFSAFCVGK